MTSDPDLKVMTFLKSNIGEKTARVKDKVTVAQETIRNVWNGTVFGYVKMCG